MTTTVEAQGPVDVKVRALPCPFCGSGRIGCHAKRSGRKSGYQCRCLGCGVCQTGSFYDNPDVAKTVWNTRSNAELNGARRASDLSAELGTGD